MGPSYEKTKREINTIQTAKQTQVLPQTAQTSMQIPQIAKQTPRLTQEKTYQSPFDILNNTSENMFAHNKTSDDELEFLINLMGSLLHLHRGGNK